MHIQISHAKILNMNKKQNKKTTKANLLHITKKTRKKKTFGICFGKPSNLLIRADVNTIKSTFLKMFISWTHY